MPAPDELDDDLPPELLYDGRYDVPDEDEDDWVPARRRSDRFDPHRLEAADRAFMGAREDAGFEARKLAPDRRWLRCEAR